PPIAASVSATSTASRRTQTSASRRPYTTKPTAAAKVSRAAIVQIAMPRTTAASAISSADAIVMWAVRRGALRARVATLAARSARQRGARNELGDRRPRRQHEQPDADQLEAAAQAPGLRQEPEHHQTEADVVRFSERVQSGQRIGEA